MVGFLIYNIWIWNLLHLSSKHQCYEKPIIDEGLFTETQLGIIGSALFFSYAAGKLVNGFIADHINIRRFMATRIIGLRTC